ncbi:MAG TPA: hypothetical protein VGL93_25650 [Streptosporangiaceae bacterium]|jgi:hypothetical protein
MPKPAAPPGPSGRAPGGEAEGPAVVLRPPWPMRAPAAGVALGALLLGALAVVCFITGVLIPGCCVAVAAAVLAIVATPILSGRVVLRSGEMETRADPAKAYTVPWSEVHAVETRRRLLTEVAAFRRGEQWVELGAPRRWRFRPDPSFTSGVDDIARRAGVPVARGARRRTTGRLLVHALLAVLWAAALVTLDPLWHSPLWPGRHEASQVPYACPVIAADARALGVQSPRHSGDRTASSDGTDSCSYGDGALGLTYDLYRYAAGQDGGIEHAARELRADATRPGPATTGTRPVPGLGDEAAMTVSTYPRAPGNASMVRIEARRANVLVRLVYQPRTGKLGGKPIAPATATAHRLAASALARITVR